MGQTVQETHGWGFFANPEARELLKKAHAGREDLVPTPLAPDAETEAVLPEVTLALGANGRRVVGMRGGYDATVNDKGMMWVVDPVQLTYRVFVLDDPASDARRIHQFLRSKHLADRIPLDRVRRNVEEARTRKQQRRSAFANNLKRAASIAPANASGGTIRLASSSSSPGIESALWTPGASAGGGIRRAQYPVCYGGGQAEIAHYDPVFIQLTDTYTWTSWYYQGNGTYTVYAGGECSATAETAAGTHWYQDACPGGLSSNPTYAFAHTENLSHNSDFGDDDQLTWVDDQADVYMTSGSPGWAVFSDDWGEFSTLIFGYTLLGWASC